MSKLDIIIPVYNKAPFLRRCLDSVASQKGDCSVILIDDGSTDESGKICDEYKKFDNFRVFHQENVGVSATRNRGIDLAESSHLTFLDADDAYSQGAVTCMTRRIGNEKIISFNHYRQRRNLPPRAEKTLKPGVYDLRSRPTCWWGVWNKVYSTEFLKENNLRFDKKVSFGEDELFNLECLMVCGTYKHFFERPLIRYFDDKNSLVRGIYPERLLSQYFGLLRILDRLERTGGSEFHKKVVKDLMKEHEASALYLRVLGRKTPEEYLCSM